MAPSPAPQKALRSVVDQIRAIGPFAELLVKYSTAEDAPFSRMKVRIKKEIVALGVGDLDVARNTGVRVPPSEWNDLIADPDVVVIDTRNAYEVAAGSFTGALNPETESFGDFPDWVASAAELADRPKVAMFCTGGIRCEKASAYLKELGFPEVYQLDGGVLAYLEQTPEESSSWLGDCYVFDRRVTVRHGLQEGGKRACVNCNAVLSAADLDDVGYERGVCCGNCAETMSQDRKARFRERQRQIDLAAERGERHIGRAAAGR